MPRLNEYFSVGFCAGYGDGDYRVSMKVQDLSRKQFNELKLATLGALQCAEDMWRRGNPPDEAQVSLTPESVTPATPSDQSRVPTVCDAGIVDKQRER